MFIDRSTIILKFDDDIMGYQYGDDDSMGYSKHRMSNLSCG